VHGDLGSTQILTRHCGAKSQSDSQLTNSGTASTRQVPVVQPLWFIGTPVDRVGVLVAPLSNNSDGTRGLHKSSVQTTSVHMKLSLYLRFQLSHSLRGYMVGTTTKF
jgi:hypothetical protein